jgi:hypothetical protein
MNLKSIYQPLDSSSRIISQFPCRCTSLLDTWSFQQRIWSTWPQSSQSSHVGTERPLSSGSFTSIRVLTWFKIGGDHVVACVPWCYLLLPWKVLHTFLKLHIPFLWINDGPYSSQKGSSQYYRTRYFTPRVHHNKINGNKIHMQLNHDIIYFA